MRPVDDLESADDSVAPQIELSPAPKKISVVTFDYFAGDEEGVTLDGEHLYGLAPDSPTILPMSFDGHQTVDVKWAPQSFGYTPSGRRLEAAILEDAKTTWVMVPDRVFRTVAYETFDAGSFDLRGIATAEDPVTRNLILTMRAMSDSLFPADFAQVADPIATALAIRTLQQLGATHGKDVPHPGGLPPATLRQVVDYIEANISKSIRLAELAGVALLSEFHFARAFKQAMNIAPVKYVWQRRVERAKEALRRPGAQLVMIAYECGFSSQSHFSTAFKNATGVTPALFRAGLTMLLAGRGARFLYNVFLVAMLPELA